MEQSWLISHSGFVPNSTYAKLWVFSSFRQILVVWSSTTCPGVLSSRTSCCSAGPCSPLSIATARAGVSSIQSELCHPFSWLWSWRTCGGTFSVKQRQMEAGTEQRERFWYVVLPQNPQKYLNARIALNLKKRKIRGKAEQLKGL